MTPRPLLEPERARSKKTLQSRFIIAAELRILFHKVGGVKLARPAGQQLHSALRHQHGLLKLSRQLAILKIIKPLADLKSLSNIKVHYDINIVRGLYNSLMSIMILIMFNINNCLIFNQIKHYMTTLKTSFLMPKYK